VHDLAAVRESPYTSGLSDEILIDFRDNLKTDHSTLMLQRFLGIYKKIFALIQHFIRLSLSLASTTSLALASLPLAIRPAAADEPKATATKAQDLGWMGVNLKDAFKFHWGFQGALLALAMWLLLILVGPPPAQASVASPETVQIGAFLTGLSDLDPSKKSFSASLWLWSITDQEEGSPLDRLEFTNVIKIDSPNSVKELTSLGVWHQRKIVGSFRHEWDLSRFPFDKQLLLIGLEEGEFDKKTILFSADAKSSGFDSDIKLTDYRIKSARLLNNEKTYRTNFGDPRLPPGNPSTYAHAELQILLERINSNLFWKLISGAIAASFFAFASFWLRVDHPSALSPRFGLLSGSLFAAVVGLRNSAIQLGTDNHTTLIELIYIEVMLYIMMAAGSGVVSWQKLQSMPDRGESRCLVIQRQEKRFAVLSTAAFLSVILTLCITYAL